MTAPSGNSARLQIGIYVFLLDINVMIFGEAHAFPSLRPLGVSGAPTKTHFRKPVGSCIVPSALNTTLDCSVCAATTGFATSR